MTLPGILGNENIKKTYSTSFETIIMLNLMFTESLIKIISSQFMTIFKIIILIIESGNVNVFMTLPKRTHFHDVLIIPYATDVAI